MKEIKQDKYHVNYDNSYATVTLTGDFLLNGTLAYEPILRILQNAARDQAGRELTLDISDLKFLNSSGLTMVTQFILYVSEKQLNLELRLQGQKKIIWQERLILNLQRLMPELKADLL